MVKVFRAAASYKIRKHLVDIRQNHGGPSDELSADPVSCGRFDDGFD
jgi:hypothetical protein